MSYSGVLVTMSLVVVVFVLCLLAVPGEDSPNPYPDEISEEDESYIKERNRKNSFKDFFGGP